MFVKSCPKVSLQSRLSRESYDAKFGMDECARNNYGVTLKADYLSFQCYGDVAAIDVALHLQ